ncbi:hypothetical protein ANCCAN_16376 [Ancylostoma caninum]|uniref:Uncharacterized protein n=2 Tax=Ancylostoma caninum TaxID=29170 RepID=A0A368FZR8_ANCCA|nr:hypothetical protein ANCCAN_16376 [Ancylostoma caninum]
MSLYWERVLSNSPTQQNVDHSGLGATTAAAQQNNTPANWDYINLGSAPPQSQQQQYHWGQHVGAHVVCHLFSCYFYAYFSFLTISPRVGYESQQRVSCI